MTCVDFEELNRENLASGMMRVEADGKRINSNSVGEEHDGSDFKEGDGMGRRRKVSLEH